jgi:hypothetical protein
VTEAAPLRVVACLHRSPRRTEDVLRRALQDAAAAGVPLHVMALAPAVDPACGRNFAGEDGVLQEAVAERMEARLREAVATLPEGTTSELVRGYGLAALRARARVGDVLVTAPRSALRARLDSVLGRV